MKWSSLIFWKSSWHGFVHFNIPLSWPGPSTQNISLFPATPLTPQVHSKHHATCQGSPARGLRWSSHPHTSATPSRSWQYSSPQNFNLFLGSYCCLFMFYFGTMGRSCQVHLLKVLWRWGAQGTFFPHLDLCQHLAQSWLPAERRESVRWKSGNGSNEHQAASQGEMNESWLPFWKQHNVGTELGWGVRHPQLLLSFAPFELCRISQVSWLLRASVSLTVKQRGYLFLPLEQMLEFSKSQKWKKMAVAKSWGVTLVNVVGIIAALWDQDGLPQYFQAC